MSTDSQITANLPSVLQEAIRAHQAGLLDKALPLYNQFLQQEQDHPTALQLAGLLHSQRGEYETAIKLMSQRGSAKAECRLRRSPPTTYANASDGRAARLRCSASRR